MKTERYAINQWKRHLGYLRLDKIRRVHIDGFIAKRQKLGAAAPDRESGSDHLSQHHEPGY
jgi:hypothetical protein